jgi:hypothetical protein
MPAAISGGETWSRSETWSSLLAALVGAIVGGAASLAGTMLVNRMQMATNARMRLYDELLPKGGRQGRTNDPARSAADGVRTAESGVRPQWASALCRGLLLSTPAALVLMR